MSDPSSLKKFDFPLAGFPLNQDEGKDKNETQQQR